MEEMFQSRQIDGQTTDAIQILSYQDKVLIYRVGDTLKDKLKIPETILSEKIAGVLDISTTPEFEILFILNENLYDEFLKVKSNTKASSSIKCIINNIKSSISLFMNIFQK